MKRITAITLWLGLAAAAPAERVHLEFAAKVATVSGTPFGLTVPRLTEVTGCIGYDTDATDTNGSADRGDYPLAVGGYFLARFLGHTILGSDGPFLQVENFSSDTFRFTDGDEFFDRAGDMTIDGVVNPDLKLQLSITDNTGAAFEDDLLPSLFPITMDGLSNPPHTFKLSDSSSNSLLLQFTRLVQVRPPVLQIRKVTLTANRENAHIDWLSEPGASYTVEWSGDGTTWNSAATAIPSEGGCTRFTDQLSTRFPDGVPADLYYRVVQEP